MVHESVDQGRNEDSAEGRDYRQYRLLGTAQLAILDLTLDFQAHGKEEYHHQYVVDELLHRHARREDYVPAVRQAHVYSQAGFEYGMIDLLGERKVGQEQCHDHAGKEYHSLGPRFLGEHPVPVLKVSDALGPGIHWNELHYMSLSFGLSLLLTVEVTVLFRSEAVDADAPVAELEPCNLVVYFPRHVEEHPALLPCHAVPVGYQIPGA